jgi:holo-[acyl-carrier protein] synthase
MILGVGIDLVEVERVGSKMSRTRGLKEKLFTEKEISYCEKKKNKAQNYAARFAAKEAFLKAMGTGWRKGLNFSEIEIVPDQLGKPEIVLYGRAKQMAEEKGIVNIQVSLTHLKEYASAVVTLARD